MIEIAFIHYVDGRRSVTFLFPETMTSEPELIGPMSFNVDDKAIERLRGSNGAKAATA